MTIYGWDNDRIFAEYDTSGNVIQETVYFGSTPIALLKDGKTYRIFADQIDTPRVITDSADKTLWAWDSKPFGESKPNEDVDGDNTKLSYNLRFPGQYYDAETGKHYNFNRDYDPVTGRYVQSDPIGLDGGMNGYSYTRNAVLIHVDKNGLKTIIISNINGGYLFGFGGHHTGLIVIRNSRSFLYDPSGSFQIYNTRYRVREPLGSSRLIEGDNDKPINLNDYISFQKFNGPDVRLYEFNTTESDETAIYNRAVNQGGGGGFDCTVNVSSAIKGIGPFTGISISTLPSSLADELDSLKNPCTSWFCW